MHSTTPRFLLTAPRLPPALMPTNRDGNTYATPLLLWTGWSTSPLIISAFLDSFLASPQPLPGSCISCCYPQVPCVSGAPELANDHEAPPLLVCMSLI
jgi:hypothetical protein